MSRTTYEYKYEDNYKVDRINVQGIPGLKFRWTSDQGTECCICVLNFRRNSWGWTDDPTGEQWYSVNNYGSGGFPRPETPEEVIRQTLVTLIGELRIPKTLKENSFVVPLWEELVAESISNDISYGYARRVVAHRGEANGLVWPVAVDGVLKRF